MRILVVGRGLPWPATAGAHMRLANVVTALSSAGDVELFCLVNPPWELPAQPTDAPVARVGSGPFRPPAADSRRRRAAWLVRGQAPFELTGVDFGAAREQFASWAAPGYDLAWFHGTDAYIALGSLVKAPTVVDFADLHEQLVTGEMSVMPGARSLRGRLRLGWRRLQLAKNARTWGMLQRRVAGDVDLATVCSEVDRTRLAISNAAVVPNGYDPPVRPVGRAAVRRPATITFQGHLRYSPNVDAAERLTAQIAPRVHQRLPGARVRLAGTADDRVRRLHDPPRVTVTGFVPDMAAELAHADIVAVPIRYGGGTRIKILESLAHRIPVVSTRIGAEGLDVVGGRHLLLADSPDEFAEACVELLTNEQRRTALADAGRELVEQRYTWPRVHGVIIDAVARLLRARP